MRIDNSIFVLTEYVKLLRIPITKTSIKNQLKEHPYHKSLLAISDLLDEWKVPNQGYRTDINGLMEGPAPVIVHLTSNSGEFAILKFIDEKNVILSNEHWMSYKMSIADFEKIFDGTCIFAEKCEGSNVSFIDKRALYFIVLLHCQRMEV